MEKPKNFYQFWQFWTGVIAAIFVAAGWIYDKGGMQTVTFDSPEQKVEHIQHVKHSPDPVEFQLEAQADKKLREDIRAFLKKDSTDKADIKKHIHNLDSLHADQMIRQTDQIFQIKEELKKRQ